MHVGVEEAVPEHLLEEDLGRGRHDGVRVVPGGPERVHLVHRQALHPLEGQHAARGAPPVHRRDPEMFLVAEIPRELRRGGGLEPEVHFDTDALRECLHDIDGVQPPRKRRQALEPTRNPEEQPQVVGDGLLDPRAQYLDGHRSALRRPGEVDLRYRGRGRGLGVEIREQLAERHLELLLDALAHGLERQRREMVLEIGKVVPPRPRPRGRREWKAPGRT